MSPGTFFFPPCICDGLVAKPHSELPLLLSCLVNGFFAVNESQAVTDNTSLVDKKGNQAFFSQRAEVRTRAEGGLCVQIRGLLN